LGEIVINDNEDANNAKQKNNVNVRGSNYRESTAPSLRGRLEIGLNALGVNQYIVHYF
jgi:hypothetical protein